jgi:hypothetical protein
LIVSTKVVTIAAIETGTGGRGRFKGTSPSPQARH